METNVVYLKDCIEGMKELPEESIDLVVTSPPYDNLRSYNDSSEWNWKTFEGVAEQLIRILKPGGVIAWNVADAIVELHKGSTSKSGTSYRQCLHFMENGLNLHDNLLYGKYTARFNANENSLRYSDVYEYCFVLSKGRPKSINLLADKKNKTAGTYYKKGGARSKDGTYQGKKDEKHFTPEFSVRNNIWYYMNTHPNHEVYQHPATMPPGLARDLIYSYSNKADVVLDPFMGSGTTARGAIHWDRKYVGYEIDKTYWELCQNVTPQNLLTDFMS